MARGTNYKASSHHHVHAEIRVSVVTHFFPMVLGIDPPVLLSLVFVATPFTLCDSAPDPLEAPEELREAKTLSPIGGESLLSLLSLL